MAQYKTMDYPPMPQYIWECVSQLVGQGIKRISINNLLQYCQLKNTHSVRTALKQLSDDGIITRHQVRTSAGGRTVEYDLHPQYAQRRIDEPPF